MAHNPEHTRLRGASGLLPLTAEEERELLALEGIDDGKLGSEVSFGGESGAWGSPRDVQRMFGREAFKWDENLPVTAPMPFVEPYGTNLAGVHPRFRGGSPLTTRGPASANIAPSMAADYPGIPPSAVATREGFSTFPGGTTESAPLNLRGTQFNIVADAAKKANQYALQTAIQDRKVNQAAHQSDITALVMSMATGQRIGSQGNSLRAGTSNSASNLAHQRRLKDSAVSKGLVSIVDKFSDQIKSKKDVENLILAIPGLDINQRKDLRAELKEWKEEDFKPMTAFVDGKVKVLFRRPGDLNKKEREAGYTFDMNITNALKDQGEAEIVGNALNKFQAHFSRLPEEERNRRTILTWSVKQGYYRNPVVMSAIRDAVGDLVPKPKYEVRYFRDEKGVMNQHTVSNEAPLKEGEVRSLDYAKRTAKTNHQIMMDELLKIQGGNTPEQMLDLYRIEATKNPGQMALLEGTVAAREQAFLDMLTSARTEAAEIVKAEADSIEAASGVLTGGQMFSVKYAKDGKTVLKPSDDGFAAANWSGKQLTKKQLLDDAGKLVQELTPENGYYTREGAEKSKGWVSVGENGERQLINVLVDSFGHKIPLIASTQEGYGTLAWIKENEDGRNERIEFNYSNPAQLAKKREALLAANVDPASISIVGSDQDRYTPNDAADWLYVNVPAPQTESEEGGVLTVNANAGKKGSWEKRYTPKFATTHLMKTFEKDLAPLKKSYDQVNMTADKIRGLMEVEGELKDLGLIDVQLVTVFKKVDDGSMVTEQEFQTIKRASSIDSKMLTAISNFKQGSQLSPHQRLAILKATQMVMIIATEKYKQRLESANERLQEMYPLMPSSTGGEISYQDILAPGISDEFNRIEQVYGYYDDSVGMDAPLLDRIKRNDLVNARNRRVLIDGEGGGSDGMGSSLTRTKQVRDSSGKLTTVPITRPGKVVVGF